MKEQRLEDNEYSRRVAKLLSEYKLAEDVHELTGEPPGFDGERLVVKKWPEELGEFPVELAREGDGGRPYWEIPNTAVPLYLKMLWTGGLNYAQKTRDTSVEFINILLEDGTYLILEGEESQVSVPYPRGLAVTHTHPNICLFSSTDLRTADRAFIMGYLIDAVMTDRCVTVVYRVGPYTEEDRTELLRRAKTVDSANTLEELMTIESINVGNLRTLTARP
ncbi:hypothetical protein HS1genome_0349 [Sulfodiicoccus acidiphilus]|uniref:Uncharacterized protein n=1 Tax=Sulfodiicoccus acidiphilus TaxID=1670455 RepID=A0A348B1A8_9CREN|nr:hypothetical protein [Sulfodiicoccus acidiphilus]BBD71960.1 hypothetical protein HS1genome_0349 [Sulfodiicoccus acidiphilus]GGT91774.1 hypothetical protein GCM10007116_06870 [Sulfodiicoccus acidiphilus]